MIRQNEHFLYNETNIRTINNYFSLSYLSDWQKANIQFTLNYLQKPIVYIFHKCLLINITNNSFNTKCTSKRDFAYLYITKTIQVVNTKINTHLSKTPSLIWWTINEYWENWHYKMNEMNEVLCENIEYKILEKI